MCNTIEAVITVRYLLLAFRFSNREFHGKLNYQATEAKDFLHEEKRLDNCTNVFTWLQDFKKIQLPAPNKLVGGINPEHTDT